MNGILLTQNEFPVFRYIVLILGKFMEIIFNVIDHVGIPNVGLAIILFTVIVNILMIPLTVKQQKFSKLSAKMNPEIQAIQAKYKGKVDVNAQRAMNEEMQGVYAKYGVSPTGSCGYLLIQFPILLGLYQVILKIPAYVTQIGDTFRVLAAKVISIDNAAWLLNPDFSEFADPEKVAATNKIAQSVAMYGKNLVEGNMENGVIDVLNRLSSSDMALVAQHYGLSNLTFNGQLILGNDNVRGLINIYNNFLGLNICDSPWSLFMDAFHSKSFLLACLALSIPLLSVITQWLNVKLMPQNDSNKEKKNVDDQQAQMQQMMQSMNTIMPLMTGYLCLTLPAGMGIYWAAGGVIRCIQMVAINKYIDRMSIDDIIAKNAEKSKEKMAKIRENNEKLNAYANMNTKNIKQNVNKNVNVNTSSEVKNAKAGSMMAKANMVNDYNKRNGK